MSDNNSIPDPKNNSNLSGFSSKQIWIRRILKFFLAVCILSGAGYISRYWLNNKPRAQRKPREVKAALVEGINIRVEDHKVTVDAMGTVVPARIIDLTCRVGGRIVRVSREFFPGGIINSGDLVAEIEKDDYLLLLEESRLALEKASLDIIKNDIAIEKSKIAIEQTELAIEQAELAIKQSELAVEQRKADIIKFQKDLALEKGQQKIARREYEVLGDTIDENDMELVLRRPQLKAAEAELESARSRLEEAEAAKKSAEAAKKSAEAAKKSAGAEKQLAESLKKTAEAAKEQAQVNLKKAELNFERTEIRAPFNAVIMEKKVDKGALVSAGMPIVTIVDINKYWVQVSLPVDRLKWINVPDGPAKKGHRHKGRRHKDHGHEEHGQKDIRQEELVKEEGGQEESAQEDRMKEGSIVRIYNEAAWGAGKYRTGIIKRLMTEVEAESRMAKLLVSVDNPLSIGSDSGEKLPMILGAYVRIEIDGNKLTDTVRIPRSSLHDNNHVWIMTPDNTLDIRKVDIFWSDKDSVYIKDHLDDGDFLITSDLAAPIDGMSLRAADSDSVAIGGGSAEEENTGGENLP